MNIMAFIPARGGSKGIPRKNLVPLNGKPLIQYTVEAAKKSNYINNIFLSSDDSEIISFCRSLRLSVSYVRPRELATDEASMIDTVIHALDWINTKSSLPDSIVLLQPTSPLRTSKDIDGAIEKFLELSAESLISVHEMIEHPYECLQLKNSGWSYLSMPPMKTTRRQDYHDNFFYINGAIYMAKTEFLLREKTFIVEDKTALYFMESMNGVDIDTMFDLQRAEFNLLNKLADSDTSNRE